MQAVCRHVLIDMWGCNARINEADSIRAAMLAAVEAVGATLLNLHVHTFSPYGVTGLAVLAESHFSIHSWPEHNYLAADVLTCGPTAEPKAAVDVLRTFFEPGSVEVKELNRGGRSEETETMVAGLEHDYRLGRSAGSSPARYSSLPLRK